LYSYFFFQAEDGIRDRNVTGVQTCALPIFALYSVQQTSGSTGCCTVSYRRRAPAPTADPSAPRSGRGRPGPRRLVGPGTAGAARSEERRVGKEGRSRSRTA